MFVLENLESIKTKERKWTLIPKPRDNHCWHFLWMLCCADQLLTYHCQECWLLMAHSSIPLQNCLPRRKLPSPRLYQPPREVQIQWLSLVEAQRHSPSTGRSGASSFRSSHRTAKASLLTALQFTLAESCLPYRWGSWGYSPEKHLHANHWLRDCYLENST